MSANAHKYNLKVEWSSPPNWDIDILAIDAENICTWIPHSSAQNGERPERYIVNIIITLLERDVEKNVTYCSKGI